MIYVIGSGPAGVSCAWALVQKGLPVTMLEVGKELESDRRAVVARMQQTAAAKWSHDDVAALKGNMSASVSGVARKLVYGSEFPYEPPDAALESESRQVDCCASYARGGFSN